MEKGKGHRRGQIDRTRDREGCVKQGGLFWKVIVKINRTCREEIVNLWTITWRKNKKRKTRVSKTGTARGAGKDGHT